MHAPRRASRVYVRRMCLETPVAIGSQGSGFVQQPSICSAPCRAALVASATETLQSRSASATAGLYHAAATTQTLSPPAAHSLGCRHTQVALRCTTVSFPLASSQLVAQALLHRPSPNCRWSGQAGSNVPQSTTVAACRSPTRWAALWDAISRLSQCDYSRSRGRPKNAHSARGARHSSKRGSSISGNPRGEYG